MARLAWLVRAPAFPAFALVDGIGRSDYDNVP